ncbi:MAG TPA: flavin reductase family protein [Pyrinomonadaceae bacterium]|jgi:flavin reductase (DIM6/NTAB) family NADH-FMN oxidoreductase RutF
MSISKEEFRRALSRFASGVTVVTTKDSNGKLYGITVSAFCSVSLSPPLILVCIERTTGSHHALAASKRFVVNILSENQQNLSNHFALPSDDKFAGVDFRAGIEEIPVLNGALVNLECRLRNSYEGGDHTIYVGEIENAVVNDGNPLLYFHGNYREIENLS